MTVEPEDTDELRQQIVEELPASPDETKADAFKRLANSRVNAALDRIRLIGNLSNRSSYDYGPEQIDKITLTLHTAVDDMLSKFKGKADKPKFEL